MLENTEYYEEAYFLDCFIWPLSLGSILFSFFRMTVKDERMATECILDNNSASACADAKLSSSETFNFTLEPNATYEILSSQPRESYDVFDLVIVSVKAFSAACLITLILNYVNRREHRTIAGKNVISLSTCLILSHSLDIANILLEGLIPAIPCFIIAFLTNYFLFASFVWTSAMSFDIMYTITCMKSTHNISEGSSRYVKYSVCVWLIALAVWTPPVIIDRYHLVPKEYSPDFANTFCDINNQLGVAIYFDGPAGVLVIANFAMFLATMRAIIMIKKLAAELDIKQQKQRFVLYVKLVIVMGVCRVLMFLEWLFPDTQYLYFTAVPDCLYGFFIFVIFALKLPSWKKIWEYFTCMHLSTGKRSEISINEASSEVTIAEDIVSSKVYRQFCGTAT